LVELYPELRQGLGEVAEYKGIDALAANDDELKKRKEARMAEEKKRDAAINDILKSLWK
jgi:hypothetical protein